MKLKVTLALTLSIALFLCNKSLCQNLPGKLDSIKSTILNEQRLFRVVLPEGYDANQSAKYDVLYVTDGEWNVEITSQIQTFLLQNGLMPPEIVVAVHHTNRDKDLTPTGGANPKVFGGADKFLSFLETELIPYINKKYSTTGSNAVFGHSFGGLFVMYALLTNPKPFDTYIAADPSFWWDNRYIPKLATENLNASLHNNRMLFIAGRGGSESAGMGIPAVDSVLRAKAPADLRWKIMDYPGETHNSVKFKSMYDGLKFMYDGFNAGMAVHPQHGIVLKDMPYRVWVFRDSELIPARYTIDGSEPNAQSELVKQEISLSRPAVFTAKTFGPRKTYNKTYTATFTEGEMIKAVKQPKNLKPGGWRYNYYEGVWDSLPDFTKLKPLQTGIAGEGFQFAQLPKQTNFALTAEGYIELKESGYYIFVLDSDDGSKLFIGNKLIINHDGLHATGNDKSYLLPLEKGFHPIRMELFQKEGGVNLNLMYITPAIKEPRPVRVPVEVQYSN